MNYKGKKGKHDDWIKGEGLKTICEWAQHRLDDKQIADNMGVSKPAFQNWLRTYADFAKAVKKASIQPNIDYVMY